MLHACSPHVACLWDNLNTIFKLSVSPVIMVQAWENTVLGTMQFKLFLSFSSGSALQIPFYEFQVFFYTMEPLNGSVSVSLWWPWKLPPWQRLFRCLDSHSFIVFYIWSKIWWDSIGCFPLVSFHFKLDLTNDDRTVLWKCLSCHKNQVFLKCAI